MARSQERRATLPAPGAGRPLLGPRWSESSRRQFVRRPTEVRPCSELRGSKRCRCRKRRVPGLPARTWLLRGSVSGVQLARAQRGLRGLPQGHPLSRTLRRSMIQRHQTPHCPSGDFRSGTRGGALERARQAEWECHRDRAQCRDREQCHRDRAGLHGRRPRGSGRASRVRRYRPSPRPRTRRMPQTRQAAGLEVPCPNRSAHWAAVVSAA